MESAAKIDSGPLEESPQDRQSRATDPGFAELSRPTDRMEVESNRAIHGADPTLGHSGPSEVPHTSGMEHDPLLVEESGYGFVTPPFHVTPDTSMLYTHRRYEEAFSALQYGITQGKGFVVITGEVGAGKTTLLRHFLSVLDDSFHAAVVFNTGLSANELLEAIADDLRIPIPAGQARPSDEPIGTRTRKMVIDAINDALLREFEAGRTVVVFIDEAQNLPVDALEALRMLSNLETEREKLIQIVLLGQPELQTLLARPDLVQLRSRIAVTYHLMPMELDETSSYIAHRIAAAQPARPVCFSSRAVRVVHEYAGGIPRIVNIVCDQALLAGGTQRAEIIEPEIVESVIAGFEHLDRVEHGARTWPHGLRLVMIALIAAIAAYGAARLYDAPRSRTPTVVSEVAPAPPAVSPVKRLLASLGVEPPEGAEYMTLDALASTSGLKVFRIEVGPETAERLRLPALLLPGNGILANPDAALVTDILEGRWTLETVSSGKVHVTLRDGRVPLCYLVPDRAWMRRPMRPGLRGDDILAMQKLLAAAGLLTAVPNGHYGQGTIAAVAALQDRFGIRGEVGVGSGTMLALYALERGR
jgi:general secretion pathway protein A